MLDQLGSKHYPEVKKIFLKCLYCGENANQWGLQNHIQTCPAYLIIFVHLFPNKRSAVQPLSAADVGVWCIDWPLRGPLVWVFCWGRFWGLELCTTRCCNQLNTCRLFYTAWLKLVNFQYIVLPFHVGFIRAGGNCNQRCIVYMYLYIYIYFFFISWDFIYSSRKNIYTVSQIWDIIPARGAVEHTSRPRTPEGTNLQKLRPKCANMLRLDVDSSDAKQWDAPLKVTWGSPQNEVLTSASWHFSWEGDNNVT